MARDIDVDNLDIDQVKYLRQRPWLIEEAKQIHDVEDIEDRMAEIEQEEAKKLNDAAEAGRYDGLKLPDLRLLAESRQLDKSGSKSDLISRLDDEDKRLAATRRRSKPISINENENDSVIGDDHPVPPAE
jgi:SAP domain-containing protein